MKTWFITGTSTGFGRHLTEQLLEQGDQVAATARHIETLDDLAKRFGNRLWRATLDVTDTEAIHAVVDKAFAELQHIDVVVSNAGYGQAVQRRSSPMKQSYNRSRLISLGLSS